MLGETRREQVERARDVARRRLRVDDYVTSGQLVELTGLSKDRITKLLEELVALGEAVCVDPRAGKGHPRRYAHPSRASELTYSGKERP